MRKAGFTLIELLVVIAVIAILVGMLLPVIMRAKERGRQTYCLNNIAQLGRAFRIYYNEWERLPGSAWMLDKGDHKPDWVAWGSAAAPKTLDPRRGTLWHYIKHSEKSYICPSDVHTWKMVNGVRQWPITYTMNHFLSRESESRRHIYIYRDQKLVKLPTPNGYCSKVVLLVDQGNGRSGYGPVDDGTFYREHGDHTPGRWDFPTDVHNEGANYVYWDGHCRWHRWDVFDSLIW